MYSVRYIGRCFCMQLFFPCMQLPDFPDKMKYLMKVTAD